MVASYIRLKQEKKKKLSISISLELSEKISKVQSKLKKQSPDMIFDIDAVAETALAKAVRAAQKQIDEN